MTQKTVPRATARQMLIINGLMLGDGCVKDHSASASLEVTSIRPDFIEWLSDELGDLVSSTSSSWPGENSWGIREQHHLRSRHLPWLKNVYSRWYDDSGRVLPERFTLTDLSAKLWYVGDGSLVWNISGSRGVRIAGRSLHKFEPQLALEFGKRGMDLRPNSNGFRLTVEHSEKFLEWLGSPIPGYEYKFAESKEEYERIKPDHLKT